MKYYKFSTVPIWVRAFHGVVERWALETGNEALFIGTPNRCAVVGRYMPADIFNNVAGVEFCRTFQSDRCDLFIDENAISLNLSLRAENLEVFNLNLCAWVVAALNQLGVPAKSVRYCIMIKDKIVGFGSPSIERNGLFVTGAAIFLTYNVSAAREALKAQTVEFDKIAGVNQCGFLITKPQLARALEQTFAANMGQRLTPENIETIRPELESISAKNLSKQWLNEGVV